MLTTKQIFLIFILVILYTYRKQFLTALKNLILLLKNPFILKSLIQSLKREKVYCKYCKYSIKGIDENEPYLCIAKPNIQITPYIDYIYPVPCSRYNSYNNCKYFKFDWLWFIK